MRGRSPRVQAVTALTVLRLVDKGKLDLDRDINTLLTRWKVPESALTRNRAITLRQLLSHTGGLMDEPDEFGPQGEEGLAAYPRTWTTEYCLLPPGRAFGALYVAFLGRPNGPRAGWLLASLDPTFVVRRLR